MKIARKIVFFGQIILLQGLHSIETSRQFTVAVAVYANII